MMFSWIFILAICIGAVWYFEKKQTNTSNQNPKNTLIEILKRRFATGEISEEEYEEKKTMLEEDGYSNLKL